MIDFPLHDFEDDPELQEKIKLFKLGKQKLALESCKSACWSCHKPIEIFTKILFPYTPIHKWTQLNRQYYAMLSIDELYNTHHAENLINFIDKLKNHETPLCKLKTIYSNTICENTLANVCPHCNAPQGNYFIDELRLELMMNELNDEIPEFTLREIEFDVDKKLISLSLYEDESTPYMVCFDYDFH